MRLIGLAIAFIALSGSAAAQAPQQFDLVCDVRNLRTGLPSSRFHARIDLAAMQWCEAPCTTPPQTLQAARQILLLTVSADTQAGGGYMITRRSVDRSTGAYEFRVSQGSRIISHLTGACRVQPYGSAIERLF